MKKPKILFGICGLGNGHTYRQLPIVEHFSHIAEVMIFAHDNSYTFYSKTFKDNPSVKVVEVAIPFYAGNKDGIDFEISNASPINKKDIFHINCAALAKASREFGKPDLVISDYESVSAQYAYVHNSPLVTIDQQSKYLSGDFPENLAGFTFKDEIERLHMFFPKATARIACSFFTVPPRNSEDAVLFFPPTLKTSVITMQRNPKKDSILVYISSAREFGQTPDEIIQACGEYSEAEFHVFLGKNEIYKANTFSHVYVYRHGNEKFDEILKGCSGIVSTAGHSLLSEAMYLEIPVYAIPVSPYEQHMNAHIIAENGFGITYPKVDSKQLAHFISHISEYEKHINSDTKILLRGAGQEKIIEFLHDLLL